MEPSRSQTNLSLVKSIQRTMFPTKFMSSKGDHSEVEAEEDMAAVEVMVEGVAATAAVEIGEAAATEIEDTKLENV